MLLVILLHSVILGSQFLNRHEAKIDCGERVLTLKKLSQLRIMEQIEIPAHSQTVLCAKLSNKLPVNVVGFGQGGRHVAAMGIMVANTTTVVLENNCCKHIGDEFHQ